MIPALGSSKSQSILCYYVHLWYSPLKESCPQQLGSNCATLEMMLEVQPARERQPPGDLFLEGNWLLPASTSQYKQPRKQQLPVCPQFHLHIKNWLHQKPSCRSHFQHYEKRIRMKWNPTGKSPSTILKIPPPFVSLLKLAVSLSTAQNCLHADSTASFKQSKKPWMFRILKNSQFTKPIILVPNNR